MLHCYSGVTPFLKKRRHQSGPQCSARPGQRPGRESVKLTSLDGAHDAHYGSTVIQAGYYKRMNKHRSSNWREDQDITLKLKAEVGRTAIEKKIMNEYNLSVCFSNNPAKISNEDVHTI